MNNMVTVVIDTNILIGASYDEFSYSRRIVQLIIDGKVRAAASRSTLRENKSLLERSVKQREWHGLMEDFFDAVDYISIPYRHGGEAIVKDDPEDDKFIYTALESGADYIISSDRHLLDLEEYKGVRMVSPKEFWYEYKKSEQGGGESEWQSWVKGIMG